VAARVVKNAIMARKIDWFMTLHLLGDMGTLRS
jgi:hypothetical protein